MDLTKISQEIHGNAVEHGFWDGNPKPEHFLMLVFTEVSEMVEADRKGTRANLEKTDIGPATNIMRENLREAIEMANDFNGVFESFIKNTVEDEMADVVIRLLDLAGSMGIDFAHLNPCNYRRSFPHFTFTENAYSLIKGLAREQINIVSRIRFGIHYMFEWAKSMGVNLSWFIRMKMRYNTTRPLRHGKAY